MKKRIVLGGVAIVLSLALVACGSTKIENKEENDADTVISGKTKFTKQEQNDFDNSNTENKEEIDADNSENENDTKLDFAWLYDDCKIALRDYWGDEYLFYVSVPLELKGNFEEYTSSYTGGGRTISGEYACNNVTIDYDAEIGCIDEFIDDNFYNYDREYFSSKYRMNEYGADGIDYVEKINNSVILLVSTDLPEESEHNGTGSVKIKMFKKDDYDKTEAWIRGGWAELAPTSITVKCPQMSYSDMQAYLDYLSKSIEYAPRLENSSLIIENEKKDLTSDESDDIAISEVDVETEVEQIRTWYYDTQNKLDSLLSASYAYDLDCYFEGGYPVKVVAKQGYNDWNMAREYYYHDRKLYFIFVYGEGKEYRIYVKDDLIIRTIAPDGTVTDLGADVPADVQEVVNRVLEEAEREAFQDLINCGA